MDEIFGEPIYSYTSDQAVEDGILFNILQVDPEWEKGIFGYITMNLMEHGYIQDEEVNIANLLDLLNQSLQIVRQASNGFKDEPESFYSGEIELPSGLKQKIFMALNEHGRYTIMLPEDY